MNNISSVTITISELNSFYSTRRYSIKTQNVIKALFIDKIKQVEIATLLSISPQRVNNIKNQFILDFFNSESYVCFEGAIHVSKLKYLADFKKNCQLLQIKTNISNPTRKT